MTALKIPKGTTWGISWPILDEDTDEPVDVTGWTVRSQVRASVASEAVLHEWSTTIGNAEAGDGFVALSVEFAESAEWTWVRGRFDVLLTNPGETSRVKVDGGTVRVEATVTRDED